MNFYSELETFLLLFLAMGGGMLIGFTMSDRAYKQEINIERSKVADKIKELSQCNNLINQLRSELAYYKTSWSSHLKKVEEYDLSFEKLTKEWEMLFTEQEIFNELKLKVEFYRSNNINLGNRLKKSVNRCQTYKKEANEMRAKIKKLEDLGDELYQKNYFLENQLDHMREMS